MPQIDLDGDDYVITLTEEILKELRWEVAVLNDIGIQDV